MHHLKVNQFSLQIHRPIPPSNNDHRQHPDSRSPVPAPYENTDQHSLNGYGSLRHVHNAVPCPLAVLHVHVWQPL